MLRLLGGGVGSTEYECHAMMAKFISQQFSKKRRHSNDLGHWTAHNVLRQLDILCRDRILPCYRRDDSPGSISSSYNQPSICTAWEKASIKPSISPTSKDAFSATRPSRPATNPSPANLGCTQTWNGEANISY